MEIYEKEEDGILYRAEINEGGMKAKVEKKGFSKFDSTLDNYTFETLEAFKNFVELEIKRKNYKLTEKY